MKVTADQLRQLYSSLETEELAQQLGEGGLTDEARSLLIEELKRRGSKEIDLAFQTAAAVQTAQKEEKARKRNWIRTVIIGVIAFIAVNGALWIFGIVGAPLLWTSADDRQCQSQGYWYANVSGQSGMIECTSWMIIIRPGRKH